LLTISTAEILPAICHRPVSKSASVKVSSDPTIPHVIALAKVRACGLMLPSESQVLASTAWTSSWSGAIGPTPYVWLAPGRAQNLCGAAKETTCK
jgi:hypothetical protein